MVAPATNRTTRIRVRISKSGQMTLPADYRKTLGVEPGDYVDLVKDQDGQIHVEPVIPLSIDEFAGSLGPPPGGKTLTEYLGEIDRTPMVRSVYEKSGDYDDRD